ncbi:DUF1993 domain-containing protein [Altererythrobacter sp.]|uniref:DUF1993 domain-containing protein n=1 Tax=Altererythrobacter sp. TaxID=1872480 RepID=UPI003D059AC0
MSLSLYDAFVPGCQQILGAVNHLIDKAEVHVKENGLSDIDLIEAKLAETMWTLPWHVRSCWVHSAYVISLLPTGEFSPDFTDIPDSWNAMRAQIAAAQDGLAKVTPDELEAIADTTVGFVLGGKRLMEFTGQNFLLSFSQPNFYFHATTFYDILRMKGVEIGKRDFMGVPRVLT